MVQINFGQREVSCKLVYYGPGMSGKTTNLEIIHQKAPDTAKGEMVSIATETDRTLYFDFLPLDLGQVAGMHTKFQLYTVPGQIYYNATRKLVLQGVDGVIFVADSQREKMAENHESIQNLRDNLAEQGLRLEDLPFVLQYNKRDLPTAMTVEELNHELNTMNVPAFEAVAKDGKGVFPTLKELSKIVIEKLNREHAPAAARRRTATSMTPVGNAGNQQAQPGRPPTTRPQTASPAQHPGYAPTPAAGIPPAPPQAAPAPMSRPAPAQPAPRPAPPAPAPQAPAQPPTPPQPAPAPAAKERHLNKARPPSLDQRRGRANQVDLGPTDPHLRRYRDAQRTANGGGGALKFVIWLLLTLIICIILVVILGLFVPKVGRALARVLPPEAGKFFLPAEDLAPGSRTGGEAAGDTSSSTGTAGEPAADDAADSDAGDPGAAP